MQVVVLRSGGVLHGMVRSEGGRYIITGERSEVKVPTAEVVVVAQSLVEAYAKQHANLPKDSAEAHLKLAEWCIRMKLAIAAGHELVEAERIEPNDSRIAMLRGRLAVLQQSSEVRNLPAARVAATHEEHLSELKSLEAAAADLPPSVVERFTRKVQPLLVNNCTASGCHQPKSNQKFQLDRAVLHGLSNRRTTLRNLLATLELVDHVTPQRSPLLVVPRERHGDMRRPIFGPRNELQLLQLVEWVALVTQTGEYAPVTTNLQGEVEAHSTLPTPTLESVSRGAVDPHIEMAAHGETKSLRPKMPIQFGAQIKAWRPKDDFDPEIFNRAVELQASKRTEASAAGP